MQQQLDSQRQRALVIAVVAAVAAASSMQLGCAQLYDGGPLESMNPGTEPLHEVSFDAGAITGQVGPRSVDGAGVVDGYADELGFTSVITTVNVGLADDVMTVVNLYNVPLVEGTRVYTNYEDHFIVDTDADAEAGADAYDPAAPAVDVVGCSDGNDITGYAFDTSAEEAEVEVVPCACEDEGAVDVVVMGRFRDWSTGELTTATTTLRARPR